MMVLYLTISPDRMSVALMYSPQMADLIVEYGMPSLTPAVDLLDKCLFPEMPKVVDSLIPELGTTLGIMSRMLDITSGSEKKAKKGHMYSI